MLEISRFSGRAARHRLGYFSRGSPKFQGGSPKSPQKCLGAPRGRFSLPRKLILGSIKSGGFGAPQNLRGGPQKGPRGASGRFSLPRKLILGSIKSGGLLCLRSLPGLICLLRLLCLLRCLSIFCSLACYDCCAYFLALLTLRALLSLLAFLMCLGPRILTSFIIRGFGYFSMTIHV